MLHWPRLLFLLTSPSHTRYMTQVTAVDAYWLAELGSVFYSVKEKSFDERGNRTKADREFSRKAELESEMAKQREE
jgi:pre-mRNA-splicing factor ATP-dependent RNA helicase DHX38/PRP16